MEVHELIKYIQMYNPMHGNPIKDIYYEFRTQHVTLYFFVNNTNFRIVFYETELRTYTKEYIRSLLDYICERLNKGELVDYNAVN